MRRSQNKKRYSNAYYNYSSEAYEYSTGSRAVYKKDTDGKTRTRSRTSRRNKNVIRKSSSSHNSKSSLGRTSNTRRTPMRAIKKVRYEFIKSENILNHKGTIFLIGTFFIFLIVMLCSFASNSQITSNINVLNNELKQLRESNTVMETEIIKNLDLDKIEKTALTKLGMQKPAKHQIVYIDVPKQSYTIQYNNALNSNSETDSDEFSLSKIWDFFFGG